MADFFEVEKVTGQRQGKNGETEYRIKWSGYAPKENQWIRYSDCQCDELILEFEIKRFQFIVGCCLDDNGVSYAIKLRDKKTFELMPSEEVFKKWPVHLLKYLEQRMEFNMAQRTVHFPEFVEVNIQNILGQPLVIGCSDYANKLVYWCKFEQSQSEKVLSGGEMHARYPGQLLKYYEEHLNVDVNMPAPFIVTRSMEERARQFDICFTPRVMIDRNMALEKYLILKPGKIIQRRKTTAPVALKTTKNIPIGVRGRKRRGVPLLFVGLRANPDGRILTPSKQQWTNSGPIETRRYTMPTTSRLVSPPPPDREDSDSDTDTDNETTIKVNFDGNMGRLYYSSDSE